MSFVIDELLDDASRPGASWPDVPLLAVHGFQDDVIGVTDSDQLIDRALPPTYYLRIEGADHTNLLGGREAALMDDLVTAFFDFCPDDNEDRLGELPDLVQGSGLGRFYICTSKASRPGR